MSTLERAIEIAAEAHAGQVDKAGEPYILHPLRVMLQMAHEDARIAAVLHDVVEDSDWTFRALAAEGFSTRVISALDALTRRKNEPYADFIERCASVELARYVKIADLTDNMDLSRLPDPSDRDRERATKYRHALEQLSGTSRRYGQH